MAIALMAPSAHAARAAEWACPASIPTVEQHLAQVPEGWEAFQDESKHVLMGAGVTIGHPRERSGAIYDSVTRIKGGKGGEILRWQLAKLHDPYLICQYFDTSVTLTRSVSGYTRCEVVEKPVGAQMRPAIARCY